MGAKKTEFTITTFYYTNTTGIGPIPRSYKANIFFVLPKAGHELIPADCTTTTTIIISCITASSSLVVAPRTSVG